MAALRMIQPSCGLGAFMTGSIREISSAGHLTEHAPKFPSAEHYREHTPSSNGLYRSFLSPGLSCMQATGSLWFNGLQGLSRCFTIGRYILRHSRCARFCHSCEMHGSIQKDA